MAWNVYLDGGTDYDDPVIDGEAEDFEADETVADGDDGWGDWGLEEELEEIIE